MLVKIRAKSAEEFFDLLRLTNSVWNIGIPGDTNWQSRETWTFRGQCDATWQLVPSAFRDSTILGFKPSSGKPPEEPLERKNEERRALVDFLFIADRVGLRVPGDGQHFRVPQLPGHPERVPLDDWPWEFALETLAIGQHHGVPTRLLDFSHTPLVAAFFACYDAWEEMGKPKLTARLDSDRRVALWAVHLPLIFRSVAHATKCGLSPRLILVTAPRALNTFLHQQDGFFIVDLAADQHDYPPLERAIEDVQSTMVSAGHDQFAGDVLVKIELEWSHVPRALAHFWNEFYSMARVEPTYDMVVKALEDHRLLYA